MTNCHQLKIRAEDGKMRLADDLIQNSFSFFILQANREITSRGFPLFFSLLYGIFVYICPI